MYLSNGQNINDTNTSYQDKNQLHEIIEKYILTSNIDSLFYLSSNNFKQRFKNRQLKVLIEKINNSLKKNGFKSFLDIGKKGGEHSIHDGIELNSRFYSYVPELIKNKINPLLFKKLEVSLTVELIKNNKTWELNMIKFNELEFDAKTDIDKLFKDFISRDSVYREKILFKKDSVITFYLNDKEIKTSNIDIDMKEFKLLKSNEYNLDIDINNITRVILFIIDKKEKNKPLWSHERAGSKPLEFIFTNDNKILITNFEKYGLYLTNGNKEIINYIKKRIITFANNGYK